MQEHYRPTPHGFYAGPAAASPTFAGTGGATNGWDSYPRWIVRQAGLQTGDT